MSKTQSKSKTFLGPIQPTYIGDFSKAAMRSYGTFVNLDRAVADVRDGLKPVQRRILWAMHHLRGSFRKSAKIVGDTMGSYHPHGDMALYQTMVNMVHDRYPLIEGQGNFGTPTDSAAAPRYTEARLTPLAEELFLDIDVAELVPNYSGDKKEPLVLPSRLPLVLLNGSSGIGVALRASIPPHNLKELLRVVVYYLKKGGSASLSTVVKHMPGPDYGYGVLESPPDEVQALYETGSGTLRYRCTYNFESSKQGNALVVTSLSPGFNLSSFLTKMRKLSEEGLIEYCSNVSSGAGIRVYVGFKDAVVLKERVLPELHTTQSYQFYVVRRTDDNEAEIAEENLFCGGLFRLLQEFVDFRRKVEEARIRRELGLAKKKLLRTRAVLAAVQRLDAVYEVLRTTSSSDELVKNMSSALDITEEQALVVLDMKVQQLAKINGDVQKEKISALKSEVIQLRTDLQNIDGVIESSLRALVKHSDNRGTLLSEDSPEPVLKVTEEIKYVVLQGNKVSRLDKEPSRRHKVDNLVRATSSVTVVTENNEAHVFSLAYLTEETFSSAVVGLVPDGQPVVVLDRDGNYAAVKVPSKANFKLIKGATSLVSACGLEGRVAIISGDGRGKFLSGVKPTRPFVKGIKSPLKSSTGVICVPEGGVLSTSSGDVLDSDFGPVKCPLFVLGNRNFVSTVDDRRDILNLRNTLELLRKGQVVGSWVLGD